MKTSTLQSLIARMSSEIMSIEDCILHHQEDILYIKQNVEVAFLLPFRYKEIEKLRKKLRKLVEIQKELKHCLKVAYAKS